MNVLSLAALLGFVLSAVWLAIIVWTELENTRLPLQLSSVLVSMASALVGAVGTIVSSSLGSRMWQSNEARAQIATTYYVVYLLVGFLLIGTWIRAGSSAPDGLVSIATAWFGTVAGMTISVMRSPAET